MNDDRANRLRAALDRWVATFYPSEVEKSQALRAILEPYNDERLMQFAVLYEAMGRVGQMRSELGEAWLSTGRRMTVEKLRRAHTINSDEDAEATPGTEEDAEPPDVAEREFQYQHGYYPRWLKRDLIDDDFPWDQAQRSSMSTFLGRYTLHDSTLVGLWLTTEGLLAVIQWDPYWVNRDETRMDFSLVESEIDRVVGEQYAFSAAFWPYLLIRFPDCYGLHVPSEEHPAEIVATIIGATSRVITDERVETVLSEGADVELRILHGPEVEMLCLNRVGRVVPIPDI